jgi:tRNA (guanine-N7-)-methyltransferase
VPDYYDKHQELIFPKWKDIFGNDNPVIIEYCTGNGTWLAEKAKGLFQKLDRSRMAF